jgi:hypothetical protein
MWDRRVGSIVPDRTTPGTPIEDELEESADAMAADSTVDRH